jgi:hypothetical protein
MSAAKVQPEGYIQFLIAAPVQFTCTEAARVQPTQLDPPAHDSFLRLLTRLQPDPEELRREARAHLQPEDGVLVLGDSTLDKPYTRALGLVGWHWSGVTRQSHLSHSRGVRKAESRCTAGAQTEHAAYNPHARASHRAPSPCVVKPTIPRSFVYRQAIPCGARRDRMKAVAEHPVLPARSAAGFPTGGIGHCRRRVGPP